MNCLVARVEGGYTNLAKVSTKLVIEPTGFNHAISSVPPTQDQMWTRFMENPQLLPKILNQVPGPTHNGRYVHWDKLRFFPPPTGLSHEDWWQGLRMRRSGLARSIPLVGTNKRPFTYSIVDPLPERLHQTDLAAGGSLQVPAPILNPDSKDSYIVRSLIQESITSSQLERGCYDA